MAQRIHEFHDDPRNAEIRIRVNGTLKPRDEAVVSVFDSGFVLGDGVGEGGCPDVQDPKLDSHSKLNCITACIQACTAGADEAFVTGTFAGLAPVRAIDGRTIGDGRPGPMLVRLQALYRELVLGDVQARAAAAP